MQVQYTAYIPIIVGAEDYITLQTSMRGGNLLICN